MAAMVLPDCAGTEAGDGGAPPTDGGGGGGSRRRGQQQNPQLDYYAPLVSARRRYSQNCATETSDDEEEDGGAGAEADSENAALPAVRQPADMLLQGSCRKRPATKPSTQVQTPGAVPFRWEQSPGRPKALHSDTHSIEPFVTAHDKPLPATAAAVADQSSSSSSRYSSPPHSSSAGGGGGSSCSSCSPPAASPRLRIRPGLGAAADLRRPCSVAAAAPNSAPAFSGSIFGANAVAATDPIQMQRHASAQLPTESIAPVKSSVPPIHTLAAEAGKVTQSISTASAAPSAVPTTPVAVSWRRRRNLSLPGSAYHDSDCPSHCGSSSALLWSSATSSPMASASIFPDLHRRRYPDCFRSAIAVADPPSASAESLVADAAYAFTRNLCVPQSPVLPIFSDCVHPNNTTSIEDPSLVSDHWMVRRNNPPEPETRSPTNTVRLQATSSCGSPAGDGSGRNRMRGNDVERIQKKPWHWRQRGSWMSSCRNDEDIGASIISWERLSAGEQDENRGCESVDPAEAPCGRILANPPSTGGGMAVEKGGRISEGRQIQAMRRVMAQMLSKATAAAKLVKKKPSIIHGRSNSIAALSTIIHCNKQSSVDVIVVGNSAAVNDIPAFDLVASREAAALREVRAILKQKQQLIFGNKINSSSGPLPDTASPAVAVSMATKVDISTADQPTFPKSQIYQKSTDDHASTNAQAMQISPDDDADYETGSDRSMASSDVDGHDNESAVDLEIQEMETSAKDAIAQRNGALSSPVAAMKLSNLSKRVGKVLRVETRGLNAITTESDASDRMHMGMKIKDAVEFEEQYYKAQQNQKRIQEAHHSSNGGTICRNVAAAVPPVFPAKCQKSAVNIDQIKASDIGWPLGISGCPPPIKSPSILRSPSSSSTSSTKQNDNNSNERDHRSSQMAVVSQNHFTESNQQPLVPLPPPLPPSPAGGSWLKKTLSSAVSLMGTSDYSSSTNSPCRFYKFSPVSATAHQWYANKWEVMLKDRTT